MRHSARPGAKLPAGARPRVGRTSAAAAACRPFERVRRQIVDRPPNALAISITIALFATTPVARADCIVDAAARHRVNAEVLRAIGWQESRLQPLALGRNADGSIDTGAFQINSVHLPELARYGIDRSALRDGCVSADVAAWHYRRQIDLQGDTWLAVGAYHSRTPARAAGYANQVAAILMRWHVLPPGALPFAVDRARGPLPPATAPERRPDPLPLHDADVAYDALAYLPSAR